MAHVAVTPTLPVLDCLWLENVTHTHAKNTFNTLSLKIPAKEARSSFPFQLFKRNTVANTVRERPSSQTATMFTLTQNMEGNRPANSAQRNLSFTAFPFYNIVAEKPFHLFRHDFDFGFSASLFGSSLLSSRLTRPSRAGLLNCTLQTRDRAVCGQPSFSRDTMHSQRHCQCETRC